MKAASLLFLRVSTGLLIVVWGLLRLVRPSATIGVSDKYYSGIVSSEMIQTPLGLLQAALGVFVILGLFRRVTYPLQAIVLCLGALAIWRHLLDPFSLFLFGDEGKANLLFFPSLGMAAATLVIWAFMDEDKMSLDMKLAKK